MTWVWGPFEGTKGVSAKTALKGSDTEMRKLLGGTDENYIVEEVIDLLAWQINKMKLLRKLYFSLARPETFLYRYLVCSDLLTCGIDI